MTKYSLLIPVNNNMDIRDVVHISKDLSLTTLCGKKLNHQTYQDDYLWIKLSSPSCGIVLKSNDVIQNFCPECKPKLDDLRSLELL